MWSSNGQRVMLIAYKDICVMSGERAEGKINSICTALDSKEKGIQQAKNLYRQSFS